MDPLTAVAVWTASLTGIAALVRAATRAASAPSISRSRFYASGRRPPVIVSSPTEGGFGVKLAAAAMAVSHRPSRAIARGG